MTSEMSFLCLLFLFYGFDIDSYHKSNTRAQKWLLIAHYGVGVSTQSTLKGAKHFTSSLAITSFTHRHTGIWQLEKNEDILTPEFEVNG